MWIEGDWRGFNPLLYKQALCGLMWFSVNLKQDLRALWFSVNFGTFLKVVVIYVGFSSFN